jgi:hypothetical protein
VASRFADDVATALRECVRLRKAAEAAVCWFEKPSPEWGGAQRWKTEDTSGGAKVYRGLRRALSAERRTRPPSR